ncbi:MAG: glycosyltransferase [Cyanobacteria bacterium P01_A01_bin.123]
MTVTEPLVSVIIPTYNRPSFLKAAIAGALAQTYTNIEVFVSDDCSPESPEDLIRSFGDPRIRFQRNPKNLGMYLNTVNTFKAARGKYVASLNDDDVWQPDFLAKLIPALEADSTLALAFCDQYIIDQAGEVDEAATAHFSRRWKRLRLKQGVYRPFYREGLVDLAVATASAAVLRKDAINWAEHSPNAGVFWDLYTTFLACRNGAGAYYCPEKLTCYRIHPQSENVVSGHRDVQAKLRKGEAGRFCYGQFMAEPAFKTYQGFFKREWAHATTTLGIAHLRSGDRVQARAYLWESWRHQPLNLRTAIALTLSLMPSSLGSAAAALRNPNLFSKAR